MLCCLGSDGPCCSGSGGLCCSGSGGLWASFPTANKSLDLLAMRNPNTTPSAKNMVILTTSLCGILVMVIWIYVPLVEDPSGDEMSNPSRSFSSSSSINWH